MPIHSTNSLRVVAVVASTGLVVASAGFGAVYAYTVGIHHGYILAGLTITFAVALELVKPLAIHGALQALGSWRTWPRALALGVLGLISVAYSLTAEISLTAASRSDLAASRALEGSSSDTSKARYDRAIEELKLIHPSRTVPEIEADIVRTNDPKRIAKLKGEKARTERREKLQAIVNSYTPGVHREADPGSASIQTYLASLGFPMKLEDLGRWLTLVPVLALEIGSALAMVLVASVSGSPKEPRAEPTVITPLDAVTKQRDAVARLILSHLQNHGGSHFGSERQLASALGTSKPTLRRSLQALSSAGAIQSTPGRHGTSITLMP